MCAFEQHYYYVSFFLFMHQNESVWWAPKKVTINSHYNIHSVLGLGRGMVTMETTELVKVGVRVF